MLLIYMIYIRLYTYNTHKYIHMYIYVSSINKNSMKKEPILACYFYNLYDYNYIKMD